MLTRVHRHFYLYCFMDWWSCKSRYVTLCIQCQGQAKRRSMHGVRGSPQYSQGYGRCGGRWTDLSVAPHLQDKHIGYVLIDLTWRNWYLHLHALHTCWCDVVVALWHPCARVCVCVVLWWVSCQWLSHQSRAVKAPVRFLLPSWPLRRSERGAAAASG